MSIPLGPTGQAAAHLIWDPGEPKLPPKTKTCQEQLHTILLTLVLLLLVQVRFLIYNPEAQTLQISSFNHKQQMLGPISDSVCTHWKGHPSPTSQMTSPWPRPSLLEMTLHQTLSCLYEFKSCS